MLLKGFNAQTGSTMSAIVTRSGVPIAWALPEDIVVDNFATMAATLLGALEVIYGSVKEAAPDEALVETSAGTLALRSVTPRMFLVALSKGAPADLRASVEEAADRARRFLSKGT